MDSNTKWIALLLCLGHKPPCKQMLQTIGSGTNPKGTTLSHQSVSPQTLGCLDNLTACLQRWLDKDFIFSVMY